MSHETDARGNHRNGHNCAQSVTISFADALNLTPSQAAQAAPRPRSEGGMCGAFLAGKAILAQLCPDAAEEFQRRFLEENGAMECKKLRKSGIPCNDLVGCAARLVEALSR